jgi:hypothetical protein
MLTEAKVKRVLEKKHRFKVKRFLKTGDELFRSFIFYHKYRSKINNMNKLGKTEECRNFFIVKKIRKILFLSEVIEFDNL